MPYQITVDCCPLSPHGLNDDKSMVGHRGTTSARLRSSPYSGNTPQSPSP